MKITMMMVMMMMQTMIQGSLESPRECAAARLLEGSCHLANTSEPCCVFKVPLATG